jgi:hypothetical protein
MNLFFTVLFFAFTIGGIAASVAGIRSWERTPLGELKERLAAGNRDVERRHSIFMSRFFTGLFLFAAAQICELVLENDAGQRANHAEIGLVFLFAAWLLKHNSSKYLVRQNRATVPDGNSQPAN